MKIDKKRFIPAIISIIVIIAMVCLNLDYVKSKVDVVYDFMSHKFNWLFISANIAAFVFSIYIILGPYKNVRLGDEKPKYSTFSWIAMMFTTSCSAGLIVFGFIESIIYSSNPPFGLEPLSIESYEMAQSYSHYHWGLNAWTLYVPITIALGLLLYRQRKTNINMSSACEPVLKKHANGIFGIMIDVFGIFGAVVAPVTSMGLGMPLLTLLFQNIFNIPNDKVIILQIGILLFWILLFGASVYRGLDKGIKKLSDINVISAFIFMFVVACFAGLSYVFSAEINNIGQYIVNFPRMLTNTDPYGTGDFVSKWTVWYWAWLIVYMPLMGVFNAKISKGRTLKEVVLGQMIFCSLGCWVAMSTLGNYAIKIQQSGVLDISSILSKSGQPTAIVEIIKTMPHSTLMMLIVAILCFIFMATTVDSSSFVAAESTYKHKVDSNDDLAPRWLRMIWAEITCIITFVLLQVGGFDAVQVLAILIGFPLAIIMFIVIASAVKLLKKE